MIGIDKKGCMCWIHWFSCVLLGFILCCLFSGCATWSKHGVILHSQKVRIAVLPIYDAVQIIRIKDIQTLQKSEQIPTNQEEVIRQEMLKVTEEINRLIEKRVADTYFFDLIPPQQVQEALTTLTIQPSEIQLTPDQVKKLGETLDTRIILTTKLSGYGKIKKKWLFYLIGSGVVEGVVQGVVAASVVKNDWVAVGVAAEEILQELVTWGGGAYLFNKIFTPVILEAELVSTVDGKVIWSDTAFAYMNRKAIKILPEEEQSKKEVRLLLTVEKAVDDLLKDLNKSAFRNVN